MTVQELQSYLKQQLSLSDDAFNANQTQVVCFVDMPAKDLLARLTKESDKDRWKKTGAHWAYTDTESNVYFFLKSIGLTSLLIASVITIHNEYLHQFGGGS
ncbi:hypothetical protein [Chromobacterium violaceum]|uniref:hypothetical protein n=1 Tax=Chromobacterium violaceum TaxID=536 RepID=UPI001B3298D6|nr:hypothetical protein [Chromobacterium violaceum]MBP4044659.1 hypothetical protein [Chromobacterium violaceum]